MQEKNVSKGSTKNNAIICDQSKYQVLSSLTE